MSVTKSSTNLSGQFHVEGLSELNKLLDELPGTAIQNVMRGALRAGANVIAEEARRMVPVDSGQLKASIRVSVRISNGRVCAYVKAGGRYKVYQIGKKGKVTKDAYRTKRAGGGFDYNTPFYAHFVEYGTASHLIRPKNGKSLFLADKAISQVNHPGAKPKPFMRPAFDTRHREAVDAFAEYLRQRLPGEIAKLRR